MVGGRFCKMAVFSELVLGDVSNAHSNNVNFNVHRRCG